MDTFVVISGCSGDGKSTLLAERADYVPARLGLPGRKD